MTALLLAGRLSAGAQETPASPQAPEPKGFNASVVQIAHGWRFREPGIAEDVPKSMLTFENFVVGRWGSSYLFVDFIRSWSDADSNAKEVYGEWYPSLSVRKISGRQPSPGFLRDVLVTVGLSTGVRTTGPAPFGVIPGATFEFNVPGFTFMSVGTFAFIDRGQFQGQPAGCRGTTYQVTPAFSLPFKAGASMSLEGYADFIGAHADCEAMVISQPQLRVDISGLWNKPGKVYLGIEWDYWHNKYGIKGLRDNVWLPLFVWKL